LFKQRAEEGVCTAAGLTSRSNETARARRVSYTAAEKSVKALTSSFICRWTALAHCRGTWSSVQKPSLPLHCYHSCCL